MSLAELTDRWAAHHTAFEHYAIGWASSFALVDRLGIDRFSTRGRVLRILFCLTLLLLVPVTGTALATLRRPNPWQMAPLAAWTAIALAYSCANLSYPLYKRAAKGVAGLYQRIQDVAGMRAQIAWDRRWFRLGAIAPFACIFSGAVVLSIILTRQRLAAVSLPLGTLIIIAMLAYQLGENTYIAVMMCIEAHRLSAYPHALSHLNPAATPAVQRAVRAYGHLGILDSLFMTVFLTSMVAMLPDPAFLTAPIMLVALSIVYLSIAAEVIVPRLAVQRIISRHKSGVLKQLQAQADQHLSHVLSTLPAPAIDDPRPRPGQHDLAAGIHDMLALHEVCRTIEESPDLPRPVGNAGRILGTLVLPLVTFVISVVGETYLSMVIEPFLH